MLEITWRPKCKGAKPQYIAFSREDLVGRSLEGAMNFIEEEITNEFNLMGWTSKVDEAKVEEFLKGE